MKVIVLRGGAEPGEPPRAGREPAPTSRYGALALSDRGEHWALVNVAPNVATQLAADPSLRHHGQLANGDVRTIILTDAQVDHVSGLLSLRDGAPIALYATPAVFEVLSQNMPVLQVLQHYCGVHWHVIPVAGETTSASFRVEGLPDLEFTALASDALAPAYLDPHEAPLTTGHTIALAVRDLHTGQRLFCAAGGQALGEPQLDWLRSADCVLLDERTTWPSLAEAPWPDWRARRKVLLARRSHGRVGRDGFEPAYDGMVIEL